MPFVLAHEAHVHTGHPVCKENGGDIMTSEHSINPSNEPQSKPVFVHVSKDHSASLNCVKCAMQTSTSLRLKSCTVKIAHHECVFAQENRPKMVCQIF